MNTEFHHAECIEVYGLNRSAKASLCSGSLGPLPTVVGFVKPAGWVVGLSRYISANIYIGIGRGIVILTLARKERCDHQQFMAFASKRNNV